MRKPDDKPALILALALLSGLPAASWPAFGIAADRAGTQSAGDMQAAVDSKMRLVKLLLDQSPAVQRIPGSGNAQAKGMLASAQDAYQRAGSEVQGGRPETAVRLLDEALRQIVAASRLVPDPAQIASQERVRYVQLSEAIRSFQALYRNIAKRNANNAQTTLAPDLDRIGAMLDKAAGLAAGGSHREANQQLNDAYKIVASMLSKLMVSETVVYTTKFDTPAEEFQYELARNKSFEDLIPVALAQLQPTPETAALSEQYAQQSRQLRDAAQQQAAGGNYGNALKSIQDATGHLQRALRVAGLAVPQAETKP